MATIPGGDDDDTLNGGAEDDVIYGDGGDDLVKAAGGDDEVFGEAGRDDLRGGRGDDEVNGGDGADTLDGGTGIDDLLYVSSLTGVLVNLGTGEARFGEAAGDVFTNFEWLTGGLGDDTLIGDDGANGINGAEGRNVLAGAGGNDSLSGGPLEDRMTGGDGDDFLIGNDGRDTLTGSAGADVLAGGAEADRLIGGDGVDAADYRFTFTRVVLDLSDVDSSGLVSGGRGAAKGDLISGVENVLSGSGDDRLTGDGRANRFEAGDGDDTLAGGGGADRLQGGSGADRFVYAAASESAVNPNGQDVILDFRTDDGDRLNLSAVDANSNLRGDQDFSFIGAQGFSGVAGELRVFATRSGDAYVRADTDGDRDADMSIRLEGVTVLDASDFIL